MKKRNPLIEEVAIWLRGRFSLTDEEKLWLLILLIICWAGVLGRYITLQTRTPGLLSEQDIRTLTTKVEE